MKSMKSVLAIALALLVALSAFGCAAPAVAPAAEPTAEPASEPAADPAATEPAAEPVSDQEAADTVNAMIEAIYVQERTDETDAQCIAAKVAWDALTDAQKALVEEGDYFALDTGDASLDDPLNADDIGENEILVVSFGTSFNKSRLEDIGAIEKAVAAAFPNWSVRRAFTAQIIINHVQSRDGVSIDNMEQALERAVANGVKNLVVLPTHLMKGYEYDEVVKKLEGYKDKFESINVAEPLLGEVGTDAATLNMDKESVAKAITDSAVAAAGYDSVDAAADDGVAFVYMGHGTSHTAKVTYEQMSAQMAALGYKNVFIGTVEGEPEGYDCETVVEAVQAAGYTKVVMRALMVVAGDHANNDMAGDDADSWKTMFTASGYFENVDCQLVGIGALPAVQDIYIAHTAAVIEK